MSFIEADTALNEYLEGVIGGAEISTTGLKVAAAAGAIAATVLSGGLAGAGASVLATSVAVGVGAGAYGAVQEVATQSGEMIGGDREVGELDWKRIGVRGSKDAILGFVGAFGAGHLARWAAPYFARLLLSRLTPDQYALEAERFGVDALTRTPQVFLNKAHAFLLDFFAGAGITPITSAVQVALDQMRISGA